MIRQQLFNKCLLLLVPIKTKARNAEDEILLYA